jgi:eukaryotic-like serine/threonine-protein kinase
MTLTAGSRLGPYEIVAAIGAGGMGEVYRAHDPRVGRDVAIKVSTEQFNERFEREIRAVASLNHSNICILHDVGPNYLVMELVEGPTLAERIKQGAIPLEESLEIARQIADALEAAHEKGIVHRDLKPANIKIKPDGTVKVLDFGLAKIGGTPVVSSENSPTLSVAQTAAGVILGTAAYMSPEQAKGKIVDKRADIWAFGCVLFEMLTGKRLFEGDTVSDTLAAVLKEEPDWENVPANIRPLLHRCLEKDPKRRLRDIGDAFVLLQSAPETVSVSRSWLAWSVAASFIIVAVALAFVHFNEKPPSVEPLRFQIPFPDKASPAPYQSFALSPDGRFLAFGVIGSDGVQRLWLRTLSSIEARPLLSVESSPNMVPIWSPDSRFIAFSDGRKLKKIDVTGSPPQTICDLTAGAIGGSWNRDGAIIFGSRAGLMRVSAAGGTPSFVTKTDQARGEIRHGFASFLPDGRHFLYLCTSTMPEKSGVYLGSLDVKPEEQKSKQLVATNAPSVYVPSLDSTQGWLLFLREQTLLAQRLDDKRLELVGEPLPVADTVGSIFMYGFFSASTNGLLVFKPSVTSQIIWIDRTGRELSRIGVPGEYPTFDLSKDSSQLVVTKREPNGQQNLWVMDLSRGGTETRLTLGSESDVDPRWSPDARQVIFGSTRDPSRSPFQVSLPSSDPVQVFKFSGKMLALDDWSPDGRYLIYHDTGEPELSAIPLFGGRKPIPVTRSLWGVVDQARFSPDSRWIAYNTNESGRYEVKVVPFPPTGDKWQISIAGGVQPTWRADGRELYFLAPDATLMAVDIRAGAKFEWGEPHPLFKTQLAASHQMEQYAPAPDGRRFLMVLPNSEASTAPFNVILNWPALLKK